MSKDEFFKDRYETPDRETVLEAENKRLKARIEELEATRSVEIAYVSLIHTLAEDLERRPETTIIVMGDRSFNGASMAKAIRNGSPQGLRILSNAVMLAFDLVTRGKEKLPA